jgi:CheY-like chemotaxis protein
LPVSIVAAPAASVPAPAQQSDAQAHCRVLVLDDNKDAADTLAMMLDLLGHDVQRLYDPNDAEALVKGFDPEIVFLDIGMPGVSGYDIARKLRNLPHGSSRMLVAVTGWGQPEDLRRTSEAGFDHHLVKPPALEDIRRICGAVHARQQVAG